MISSKQRSRDRKDVKKCLVPSICTVKVRLVTTGADAQPANHTGDADSHSTYVCHTSVISIELGKSRLFFGTTLCICDILIFKTVATTVEWKHT